ncbi:MAG: endonuclease/exonuclease/phosphatase family protein [Actinomycetota bacterium]
MDLTIGTFNLNNLFSRWNFQAVVPRGTTLTQTLEFGPDAEARLRTFKGRVVTAKDRDDTETIATRILDMDVDVLAVQEVENIEALRTFNRESLNDLYPNVIVIEGNDPRLIDVGLLSKFPVGQVVSHQTAPDPDDEARRIFGRDLLRADILTPTRSRRLLSLFNTHMKSNFVDRIDHPTPEMQAAQRVRNTERRQRQSIVTKEIIEAETRPNSRYVLLGDMNDDPDSDFLAPVLDSNLGLVDALADVSETRESKTESLGPQPGPRWTSRHKESGQPPTHRLFDQIWVSPSLERRLGDSFIDRRTKHGGDGSDHDPAWVALTGL